MDGLNPEIERIFAAQAERRLVLAAMPFPEKIKAIIKMQEMVAPILRLRGKTVVVWRNDASK